MRNLFGLVVVFCFVAIAPAQERLLGKAEFDAIVAKGSNHHVIWKGNKYRMTVTTSSKAAGRPQTDWSSTMTFEYASPDYIRTTTSSVFGDKTMPVNEAIRIGSWIYSRLGDGLWTRKEYTAAVPAKQKNENPIELLSTNAEYKYLGTGNVRGTPVQIYLKTEKRTSFNKDNGENSESDVKVTYWVDSNGTVIMSEYASETRGPRIRTETLITTVWERDPSITVAVPEVSQ